MAKPIRNTPVLRGKDLVAFHREMARVEALSPAQKRKERERIAKSVEMFALKVDNLGILL